ncbi:hypothetical protein [Robiginitalea sp. SC105]|uniref:hypothetical protein n=1 Tax=Robiginitalea sp. SC105 TaxID=2762332 RepID=UPI00163B15AB|nr:hypothetical protein [Robiginitalea sp. SC105]MBC2840536.1 hypothetical protein [Robiginitalea sp. SC105]
MGAFAFSIQAPAQSLYEKGKIQINKRKVLDAYIQIDFRFPQRFQEDITYIEEDAFLKWQKTGKLKNKHKIKLKLSKFEGFTLENGKVFEVVSYADLTKKKLGMLPKKLCLERIADGKVKAYKLYSHTTGKISHELADVVFESKMNKDYLLIDYIRDNFQILVQKVGEHKNPRNLQSANLLTLIGDDDRVRTNYDQNHYGFRDQFVERQKFGVIVNQEYEKAFLKMLNDYNGPGMSTAGTD